MTTKRLTTTSSTLALIAGLLLGPPALAGEPAPGLPLVDVSAAPDFEHRIAWSPGVRRSPEFLRRLEEAARDDLAAFRASVRAERGRPAWQTGVFERGVEERFASERLASVVVITRLDRVRSFARPVTWDVREARPLGWADLLADAAPGSPGVKAVAGFAASRAGPAWAGQAGHARGSREYDRAVGWISARADALPGFTLVPSKEAGRVAGLSLHVGPRTRHGLADSSETFLPASAIVPYLAPAWRDLFGGEPLAPGRAAQRAADEPFAGMPAFLLTPEGPPARVLTVRGEVPEAYLGEDGLDFVLYPDSDEGRKPLRARASLEPPGRTSGTAWATRAFVAIFRSTGKPLDNSCRTEALHAVPGKGSPAQAAGLPPLSFAVPVKVRCDDYDG